MKASCVREKVGDDMIIGVSAHTVEEAVEAVKNGADYLGAGAVFGSSTKQNAGAMKKETLRSICEAVRHFRCCNRRNQRQKLKGTISHGN